jgi:hypothetical protein
MEASPWVLVILDPLLLNHAGLYWLLGAGILVLVLCRRELSHLVGEVATASVACGLMGVAGNKGAAAVSLTLFRR